MLSWFRKKIKIDYSKMLVILSKNKTINNKVLFIHNNFEVFIFFRVLYSGIKNRIFIG